ncbi:exodeoxyribonuclease VII small subunit [candidate division KSB1 bacterium]|nr:exodeoxyribonuclease VII small subunit [candidate division KSB1 bacterium]
MKKMTFEQAITRLEEITLLLQEGTHSLDESLNLFEEGTELAAFCKAKLKDAEDRVLLLTKTESGFQTEKKNVDTK